MNYYERHIGDYLKDTAHLSLLEHGVYSRLLDVYYTRECPISDAEAARLIGARSRDEKAALRAVLAEFFYMKEGSLDWSHKRCDAEIARYLEIQEDAGDRRENDKERQRRSRERRKLLFAELRAHDIVPAWDTKTSELEALLSRVTKQDSSAPVTPPVTRDNTATQTPVPDTSPKEEKKPSVSARGSRLPAEWSPGDSGVAYAEQHGIVNGRLQLELEKFRDWWSAQPGQKGVKADWLATWRTWIRNAVERSAGKAVDSADMFAGVR